MSGCLKREQVLTLGSRCLGLNFESALGQCYLIVMPSSRWLLENPGLTTCRTLQDNYHGGHKKNCMADRSITRTHSHLVVGAKADKILEHERGSVFYGESDILEPESTFDLTITTG